MRASTLRRLSPLLLAAAFAAPSPPAGARPEVTLQRATTGTLGGAVRFRTHISTDKPIYREGEAVHVRGVLLDANTHAPVSGGYADAQVEIRGPKGDVVASGGAQAQESVIGFDWKVPPGAAGGAYSVVITYPFEGHAPAERTFDVRAYRPPRLKSQIVFVRDGYGPGDTVQASLHTERAEGGIPTGASVEVTARVDGTEVHRGRVTVDLQGNCTAKFALPESIQRGEGTLAFAVADGGVVETATKTIPIILTTVDLTMYPEGGELVAGLPNRVYLEAKTPAGKPADLEGVIVDGEGREVATVKTEHEGRGRFDLTPAPDATHVLRITKPTGITTTFPLPPSKKQGVVLRAQEDVTHPGRPVRLQIGATTAGSYVVTLAKGEVDVGRRTVRLGDARARGGRVVPLRTESFEVPREVSGVLVATVWSDSGAPLAERLVLRRPDDRLRVEVKADAKRYVPGGAVKLTVTTRDGRGKPVPAVVGLTITDESVLEMIDKREQAPRLPVMVLLEDEVRDLADAHVYLSPGDPKAPLAADLLLGTQGWRRFALRDLTAFIAAHGDEALRAVAFRVPPPERPPEPEMAFAAGDFPMAARAANEGGPMPLMAVPPPADRPQPRPPSKAAERPAPLPQPVAAPASKVVPAEPRADARDDELEEALADAGARRSRRVVAREKTLAAPSAMTWVRIYAHAARPDRAPGDRVDFTETLYWSAGVSTGAEGTATVTFATSDSVTAFRVMADAFDTGGNLAESTTTIESVEPFYIEPKMPLSITSRDVVRLPVAVVNATAEALKGGTLTVTAPKGIEVRGARSDLRIDADSRERYIVEIATGDYVGEAQIVVEASAGAYRDRVTRTVRVEPLGFPIEIAAGGMLSANASETFEVAIPQTVVPGSIVARAAVFPTPLASLTGALEGLLSEPHGCFEQTSSTNYPLVMAQQYFTTHTGVDPALIERSRELLDKGYQRLTGFECKETGYEWFGQDPGHEALSAYGLLEFTDMAEVYSVDRAMLGRTRTWLLAQRDGKGGFKHQRRALHTWLVEEELHNGYITWALLESGEKGIAREAESFAAAAANSPNSYVTALGANVAALNGDRRAAERLMAALARKQAEDGRVDGSTTSIVGSRGDSLEVETTALAVLGWLRDTKYAGNVEKGIQWLADVCKGGRYGSTQSTVLALRAIMAYDRSRSKPKAPGELQVVVDGSPIGGSIAFDGDTQGSITVPDFSNALRIGQRRVALRMAGGAEMPYTFAVRYYAEQPESSPEARVSLTTELRNRKIREGDVTEIAVTVINLVDQPVPTPVAIIGVPGGLEVRHDQLKELVKAERIAAYEVIGRDVVLYWRELPAKKVVSLPVSLVASVPGTYTGPASRAYEYYGDEYKRWTRGTTVEITPAGRGR